MLIALVHLHLFLSTSYLYYHPNRLTASPCAASVAAPYQFIGDSSSPLIQAQQSQNSPFLFQHRNANVFRTHFQYILSASTR